MEGDTAVKTTGLALAVVCWMVLGLYVGIGGWFGSKMLQTAAAHAGQNGPYIEYEGLSFLNEANLREFLRDRPAASWFQFTWIFAVPQSVIPLVTALGCGLLGGVLRLLKTVVIDHRAPSGLDVLALPPFGALVGVMLFFLAFT